MVTARGRRHPPKGPLLLEHALVVAAALASAVFIAIGIVVRQRATLDVPEDQGVSAVMIGTLVRRPIWWAGTGSAITGFVFQAIALANGSLLLVAPLLVSALLFALPLSARLAGRTVTRVEWIWASVLTAALAVFVMLARAAPGDYNGWRRALLLASAVGMLFGVVAVLTKIVMNIVTEGHAARLLVSPVAYVLALVGVVATLLQQSAFHAGSLQASVPAMLVLEPVVAVLLGQMILGEHLIVNPPTAVVLGIALAAMAAATIALGRDEGAYEEQLEASRKAAPVRQAGR